MLVDSAVPTTGIAPPTSLASSSSSPFHIQQAGSSRRMGGNSGDSRSSATPGEDRERLIGRER
jgi:hypothetical protein